MSGLPKLPGFTFNDSTLTKFHLPHTFDLLNGYKIPKPTPIGIGSRELAVNTVAHIQSSDPVRFDPSLTYGRTRSVALPQYVPHFALYDQKCLTFQAFFKQSVPESPLESYRVRQVNIIYFLEDDTITVMEPKIPNSGLEQGRLVKRNKIPKTDSGDVWHWKDLNVGKDICMYGIVFHTVGCDTFTKEFMKSQGLIMGEPEEMPPDLYTQARQMQGVSKTTKTKAADDKLRRYLEYDGKILKFDAIWDTRDEEYGEMRLYHLMYFLADDSISVKEVHEPNSGRDPFPLLLKKRKMPKIWTDRPVTYPSVYMELSDAEVTEYYQPKDLLVGETVFVLGRRMLLVDCDPFTRSYYRKALGIVQKPPIQYKPEKKKKEEEDKMPPHVPPGTLEDTMQNTRSFLPKPPRKDVLKQLLNANKYLRYELKIDAVHPEDEIRRFIMKYSLADGTCVIHEPPIKNSGVMGGKYLRASLLAKPGSDPLNPDYYTPADFYIGAIITIHEQRFVITEADLYVYRYMQANPEKFPCDVMENMRNFMFNKGYLTDDVTAQVEKEREEKKKADRDAIGKEYEVPEDVMQKCLDDLKGGAADPEYERAKRAQILQEYEDSLKPTYVVPGHGIAPVNLQCPYPISIGKRRDMVCKEEDFGPGSMAPKHIETPEEIEQKRYAKVLKEHHQICEGGKPIPCAKPDEIARIPSDKKAAYPFEPIMISPVPLAKDACKVKPPVIEAGDAKCMKDRYDVCNLKNRKPPCGCTQYEKC